MNDGLQWGGRFAQPPDRALLAFGSSLDDDLILAPFDVRGSIAHVGALRDAGIVEEGTAAELERALTIVADEITNGTFADYARHSDAEDIHGAIDARVRDLAGEAGDCLHSGRSRNDQVATALRLYVHDRMLQAQTVTERIVAILVKHAEKALAADAIVAATTHWQPAQPVLLAFWLGAAAEPFARALKRFAGAASEAMAEMPLGSAAVAGSTLALGRERAAKTLGFERLSLNAMDAIGTRDTLLDGAHALVRALAHASRVCEELILWCTPQFGYAVLGDAASTGSSLMPQKRNPDPFELIRGAAAVETGAYGGAVASTCGLALSYHRDLQQTKAAGLRIVEQSLDALRALAAALEHIRFDYERMQADAGRGFTVATDVADALIARGITARRAHAYVGEAVALAESEERDLDQRDLDVLAVRAGLDGLVAPLTPLESVRAKATIGSTAPASVKAHLLALRAGISREAFA